MPYTVSLVYASPGYGHSQYFLQLTWTDSTDPNATSVNVYRGTVSGGPYSKISNVAEGIQIYNDFGLAPKTTYFYVLTEVDNVGSESAFSIQMSGSTGPA